MSINELTPEEERVIVQKGTEQPFSGEYCEFDELGTYCCKRCSAELFDSSSKFDAGCGWPSFDDEIPGAVRCEADPDGKRTEILCAACGAHLGHVFLGEGLTTKNVRHCVNSISMVFSPGEAATMNQGDISFSQATQRAIFAGGCFWGMEHHFAAEHGVVATRVGYCGGDEEKPTYEQICAGVTDHAEAIEVTFNTSETSFEKLAKVFFEIHDPTEVDRQGPDVGEQYRSAVFFLGPDQEETARSLIGILSDKGLEVATEVVRAGDFWPAEDYHQNYYQRTGKLPYCHVRMSRF